MNIAMLKILGPLAIVALVVGVIWVQKERIETLEGRVETAVANEKRENEKRIEAENENAFLADELAHWFDEAENLAAFERESEARRENEIRERTQAHAETVAAIEAAAPAIECRPGSDPAVIVRLRDLTRRANATRD